MDGWMEIYSVFSYTLKSAMYLYCCMARGKRVVTVQIEERARQGLKGVGGCFGGLFRFGKARPSLGFAAGNAAIALQPAKSWSFSVRVAGAGSNAIVIHRSRW